MTVYLLMYTAYIDTFAKQFTIDILYNILTINVNFNLYNTYYIRNDTYNSRNKATVAKS